MDPQGLEMHYRGEQLEKIDAIIPRIGSSGTSHGAAVIQQFVAKGVFSTLTVQALMDARNKLRSLQLLTQEGLAIPRTFYTQQTYDIDYILEQVGGLPIIIKLLKGTHGLGVMLLKDRSAAESVIETFGRLKESILIQAFIEESQGEDIRALVVGGQVVAAMKRKAPKGEFRSNLHRGGTGVQINLTPAETEMALHAAATLGLDVAGVDMLQSKNGPLLLEVNPSPGLEGIETVTKVKVAEHIIQFIEQNRTAKISRDELWM